MSATPPPPYARRRSTARTASSSRPPPSSWWPRPWCTAHGAPAGARLPRDGGGESRCWPRWSAPPSTSSSERLNAGATGILQSALGNLPELFICLFALRAGLTEVATSAVIGSILANILLVLGLAFAVGGLQAGHADLLELERAA